MKKKSLIALLALIVACMLVFAACGDKSDSGNDGDKADDTTVSTELTTDENGEVFTPNEGTPVTLPTTPDVTDPTAPAGKTDAEKVADYVALKEDEIISSFESGFSAGGMTCSSTVKTEGTGIILTININELENLTEAQKTAMQTNCDAMAPSMSASLGDIQSEIPELTYVKVNLCEKDGDFVAVINIGEGANEGTSVLPPSTPAVNEPTYSAGSVSYVYTEAGNENYVGFTFMYDANQNVTEVLYVISGKDLPQEDIDSLEDAYDSLEQVKNMGCNITADILELNNEHRLEATIRILTETDVSFIEGMLDVDFPGAIIPIADAEAAVVAEGFEKVTA